MLLRGVGGATEPFFARLCESEPVSYHGLASPCALWLIASTYGLSTSCGFFKERNGIHGQLAPVGWERHGAVSMGHTAILWWDQKTAAKEDHKPLAACSHQALLLVCEIPAWKDIKGRKRQDFKLRQVIFKIMQGFVSVFWRGRE